MLKSGLSAALQVFERQYKKYATDLTEKLKEETLSARCHNIDTEEMVGMFSAVKQRAPECNSLLLVLLDASEENHYSGTP